MPQEKKKKTFTPTQMSSPEEGSLMECNDDDDSEDKDDYEQDVQIPPYLCKIITQLSTKYKDIQFPENPQEQLNNVLYSQIASNLTLMTLLIEFGATVTKISIPQYDNNYKLKLIYVYIYIYINRQQVNN